MLSTLKRWLATPAAAATPRPAHDEFQPGLVPALRADHRQLLAIFAELKRASAGSDEAACRSALDRFTCLLQDHLLTENRHLYGYLARHPDPDPEVARQVDIMSADMMRVGKILHRFIATYARATWTGEIQARIRADLRTVGEVLMHRIHEEETVLYQLYAPRAG